MTQDPPAILDAEQCAALMRCSTKQVEELARQGDLAGTKPGRSWLFVYTDVVEFLRRRAKEEAEDRKARLQAPRIMPPTRPVRRGANQSSRTDSLITCGITQ